MRTLLSLLIAVILAAPARAQIPDSTFLSRERADALTGLYVLEDGRVIHVMDLRDQVGGRAVLSVTEYASGRARALYPLADSGFEAGRLWFRRDTIAYRVRFDETSRPAPRLTFTESGRTLGGRRAPLVEREVTVRVGDVRLAGTLVLPPGRGPHPALVMVSGSGPETRRVPRYVGDYLAYHGVAVLAYDKRGTGASTGGGDILSHAEWASDVEALLDFLRAQPDVDTTRLGLYGNSEGGYMVPVVAARRPDVRFVVCRVCSALPFPAAILDVQTGAMRREGVAESEIALAAELLERMMRYAVHRTGYDSLVAHAARIADRPWRGRFMGEAVPAARARFWDDYRGVLTVDPREHYARIRVPVLVLLGERDNNALLERNRPAYDSLIRAGANLTLWVVPEASHGLMLGPRNSLGYPPGLHERLAAWVARAAGVRAP